MKKVLIADDEFLVRLGLKSTINWEEYGFLIVDEAKNGKEALELFEKHDPDILLTDIRMPVINGLELIQELKKRKKALKTVILSHYDDFNYAREAIKLGASEYILKSDLSSENLLAVLNKISSEIDATNNESVGQDVDSTKKSAAAEDLCKELFQRLQLGCFKSAVDVTGYINENGIVFEYNSFAFVSGIIEDINNTTFADDHDFFIRTVTNISSQVFKDNILLCIMRFEREGFTFLINADTFGNTTEVQKNIRDLLLSFKKQMKQFLDVNLIIGLSKTANYGGKLPELLEQSRIAFQSCFFESTGIQEFSESMTQTKGERPQVNLEALRGYVKAFDIEGLVGYINEIFDVLSGYRIIEFVKDSFVDLLSYAKIIARDLGIKNIPALNESKFSYSNFDKLYNIDSVHKYILDIFNTIMDNAYNNKEERYSFIISKSIHFIKENYQKNIALSEVAEHAEISSSYLSLLFKQETGINFSSYLTNYRIEMSKKLLLESNMKIYEIAEKVGFENPYYFSKVFKETTGLTCKDFKRVNYLKESFENQ